MKLSHRQAGRVLPVRRGLCASGAAGLVVLFAFLAAASAVLAQARYKYMSSSGHECSAMNCVSEVQRREWLASGVRKEFTYHCSDANPFLQNWDAEQHRFIYVVAKSFTKGGVTVVARNNGSIPGAFSVVLGCATTPSTGTSLKTSNFFRPRRGDSNFFRRLGD